MGKTFWVRLEQREEAAGLPAYDAHVDWVWVPGEDPGDRGSDLPVVGEGVRPEPVLMTLRSARDVEAAAAAARSGKWVVVDCPDWRIIPWESLVGLGRVLARVTNTEQARQALGVLERGLDGVVLESADPEVIREVGELVHEAGTEVSLVTGTVKSVTPVGQGDRACVDAAVLFRADEGLLLGDRAGALFLVASETRENPFIEPRPFRVNAGGVHLYVLLPGDRTGYLAELGSGKTALAVDADGRCRTLVVGRLKIERRPLVRVVAEYEGAEASILLQNAETVCLLGPDRERLSVATLEPGQRVLMHPAPEARHLGRTVDEWVLER